MNEDSMEEFRKGMDCYDPEIRLFPTIAEKVGTGEGLSKRDVLLILREARIAAAQRARWAKVRVRNEKKAA
jgi:hypothetical protein